MGKPEILCGDLQGCFSRRIDSKNRIVYRIYENRCEILQVGTHYQEK
ncbi:Txe/YoeB family addiction module toxin [Helicobacter anseris]|uniref:Txe/YoeB family addiction module toxin n=1 Tax=Helicobacter anseris TaxID=375926 RepID=A0A3D8J903_9HELI|nr:type II toxin-antitoxin system YoeB family toxin [Helicobacter anseris]RDU73912.1 Txe/YoeB family addiction module toxin [Helicobacter anseris]